MAKQVLQENAGQLMQTFFFGKLPIAIQQELMNRIKEDASPEEIKAFLTPTVQPVHAEDNVATLPSGSNDGK